MGFKKLEKSLFRKVTRAAMEFGLVQPDDRIMVCLSGGKDSYAMLHFLRQVQRKAPFDFSLVAVNLDQGQPGFDQGVIVRYLEEHGYEHHMVMRDTYSVVTEKVPEGKTYCSLCSRLRRGILYSTAEKLGATKIALGHHRDDLVETLLLNIFFSGQLKTMPPMLVSDDKKNKVIRPLALCPESDIAEFARIMEYPILPCDLCGSQENLQRKRVKRLLDQLETEIPEIRNSILASLGNVKPTHLLDKKLLRWAGVPIDTDAPLPATDDEPAASAPRFPILVGNG